MYALMSESVRDFMKQAFRWPGPLTYFSSHIVSNSLSNAKSIYTNIKVISPFWIQSTEYQCFLL